MATDGLAAFTENCIRPHTRLPAESRGDWRAPGEHRLACCGMSLSRPRACRLYYPLIASFTRRVSVYCRNRIALPPRNHQTWANGAWKLLPVALQVPL